MSTVNQETRYIVHVKHGVDKTSLLNNWVKPQLDSQSRVIHDYNIIHAFCGSFTEESLANIRSYPEVLKVEKVRRVWPSSLVSRVRLLNLYVTTTKRTSSSRTSFMKLSSK